MQGCVICMKLTVVRSVSNNSSLELVRSSNLSIRCHPRSSSFPSRDLNVVSSKISTLQTPPEQFSPVQFCTMYSAIYLLFYFLFAFHNSGVGG